MKTLLALLLLATTLATRAATVFYTVNTTTNATSFTNTVALPRFNGNLGRLTNVSLNISWTHTRTNHIESAQYDPFSYSVDVSCTAKLLFPDGTTVKKSENHSTWFAGDFNNQGATDDSIGTKTDFMNAKVCSDFPAAKAVWIGTGTIPFQAVMQTTVTTFTTPSTASSFQSTSSSGYFSVTIIYSYTPGPPGNGLCQ